MVNFEGGREIPCRRTGLSNAGIEAERRLKEIEALKNDLASEKMDQLMRGGSQNSPEIERREKEIREKTEEVALLLRGGESKSLNEEVEDIRRENKKRREAAETRKKEGEVLNLEDLEDPVFEADGRKRSIADLHHDFKEEHLFTESIKSSKGTVYTMGSEYVQYLKHKILVKGEQVRGKFESAEGICAAAVDEDLRALIRKNSGFIAEGKNANEGLVDPADAGFRAREIATEKNRLSRMNLFIRFATILGVEPPYSLAFIGTFVSRLINLEFASADQYASTIIAELQSIGELTSRNPWDFDYEHALLLRQLTAKHKKADPQKCKPWDGRTKSLTTPEKSFLLLWAMTGLRYDTFARIKNSDVQIETFFDREGKEKPRRIKLRCWKDKVGPRQGRNVRVACNCRKGEAGEVLDNDFCFLHNDKLAIPNLDQWEYNAGLKLLRKLGLGRHTMRRRLAIEVQKMRLKRKIMAKLITERAVKVYFGWSPYSKQLTSYTVDIDTFYHEQFPIPLYNIQESIELTYKNDAAVSVAKPTFDETVNLLLKKQLLKSKVAPVNQAKPAKPGAKKRGRPPGQKNKPKK